MSESQATPVAAKTGVAALDGLFAAVNRSDAPGLVVGVAQHGQTVYRRGFGLASIEQGVANTAWTRMRIGSTSKHFACVAVLLLAEDGLVDVDASVRRYIPELPVLKGEPTLRQLMSHTGGYRCFLDIGFLSDGMAIRPKGAGLAAQVRQTDVNFAPGESMMYNNGGYHLLAHVIARVSGKPFEQFLQDRIFTPLAMRDTASVPSDFEIHRGVATLHVPLPAGGYRRGIFPTEEILAEGAMISTIDDMLRWLAHLRGPRTVGSESTWAQMTTPARLNNGTVNPYALGLMRHDYRGVEVIHHAGSVIGGACQMLTVPSHALDIIIISNGASAHPTELANQVVDAMLGDALTAAPIARPATERFKSLLGARYHSAESGLVIGFGDADGKLGLNVLNNHPIPLRDDGDALRIGFQDIAAGPLVVPVAQLEDGPPDVLTFIESGTSSRYVRLPQAAPALAEVGPALVGRYRSTDLDSDAEIRFDGELLNLHVFGAFATSVMTLEPFTADVFGWSCADPNLPIRGVFNAEREGDRVARFFLDTVRSRHIRFDRVGD